MAVGDGWDPPPEAHPWSDFHWWKVSPGRVLELVILSEAPLWYTGHFLRGRMRPCYGDDCEECKKGTGGQIRYVLAGVEVSSRRVGLLELGRAVGLQIRDYAQSMGTARGMWLEFGKESHAKQSRMIVQMIEKPVEIDWMELSVPNMKEALVATWTKAQIPLPEGFTATRSKPPNVGRFQRPG